MHDSILVQIQGSSQYFVLRLSLLSGTSLWTDAERQMLKAACKGGLIRCYERSLSAKCTSLLWRCAIRTINQRQAGKRAGRDCNELVLEKLELSLKFRISIILPRDCLQNGLSLDYLQRGFKIENQSRKNIQCFFSDFCHYLRILPNVFDLSNITLHLYSSLRSLCVCVCL